MQEGKINSQSDICTGCYLKKTEQKTTKQQVKKKMQPIERVRIVRLVYACVCVCVYGLDGEGTWVYRSVSTALVVVSMDSFVSDWLLWLCDQFLWLIFPTL